MSLYHKDLGIPADLMGQVATGALRLRPSRHAATAIPTDRYYQPGDECPSHVQVRQEDIFEVAVEHGRVTKYAVRLAWDEERDLILVISRDRVVITAWFNHKDDGHRTLDARRYTKGV